MKQKYKNMLEKTTDLRETCERENRAPTAEEAIWANAYLDELEKKSEESPSSFRQFDPSLDGDFRKFSNSDMRTSKSDKTYRSMFQAGSGSLDRGGFENTSEFIQVLGSSRYDSRLVRAIQSEGVPSAGGFSVPEEFASQWLDDSLAGEIVRPLCQVWPMQSETRLVPAWDGADRSSGELFGGFKMQILAEGATASKQTGKVRQIKLAAKKGAIYCDISSELAADGLGFESQLKSALKKSIGYGFDKYCLTGTGAGVPQGVFNSSCLISVNKEAGQAADTIVYENIVNMYSRQLNKNNAVWLFNDDAVPALMQISIAVGTGGSHVKLLNEQDGKFTIFGRPVIFSAHMPTVGDAGDCGFVDFGAYALGLRKDISIDKSVAPGWSEDLVSYRIIVRFDGQGVLDSAITPENGATLSPFITMNERA